MANTTPAALAQPEMIVIQPPEIAAEVLEAAEEWVKREKSALFAFICTTGVAVPLSKSFVDSVYRARKDFQGLDRLDILLDHYGGDIEAAYQLIVFFRRRCKTLRVFVPDYAKSAATLFALGADEVWMSDTSEIGPLDAQIPDQRDPDRRISALDEFRAVDYLRKLGSVLDGELEPILGGQRCCSAQHFRKLIENFETVRRWVS